MPPGGLNIRLADQALDKEARLHDFKRDAILAFARANSIDKQIMSGGPDARIGIVSTGKSYLDVREALDLLGIDEVAPTSSASASTRSACHGRSSRSRHRQIRRGPRSHHRRRRKALA